MSKETKLHEKHDLGFVEQHYRHKVEYVGKTRKKEKRNEKVLKKAKK